MALKQLLLLLLLLPGLLWSDSSPTTEQIQKTASEIGSEVLSPYCPGRSLADCPSSNASKLKEEIRSKLAAGQSRDEILDYLYGLYGDEIRAAPRFGGFGIWAWLTPILFVGLGLVTVLIWLRHNSTSSELEANSDNSELSD